MPRKSPEEQAREWREEGFQEGLRQGRSETIKRGQWQGAVRLLLHQLELRFGSLPEDKRSQLQNAYPQELETWSTCLLSAMFLDDIFDTPPTDDKGLLTAMIERIKEWQNECHREGFRAGLEQGNADGISEGTHEGIVSLFTHQLTHYFGPLPEDVRSQLQTASIREIGGWAEGLFGATTLDDIFQ